MFRQGFLVGVLGLLSIFATVADTEPGVTFTPSVGAAAILFAGPELFYAAGPLVQAELGYRFENGFQLGARAGGGAFLGRGTPSPVPLFGLTAEFPVGSSVAVGVSGPVFPSVLFRFGSHRFDVGVLPIYPSSGGSTTVTVLYGSTFDLFR